MPHSAESVQMFAILLFHFFTERSPWKAKKLNTTVTKVKVGKAPGPDGFATGFCFNK